MNRRRGCAMNLFEHSRGKAQGVTNQHRSPGDRRVESCRERGEGGRGAVPSQLVHVVEERDVGPERGERSEQQRAVALARERVREGARVGGVHVPLAPVRGDGFEMAKLGENGSRRLRAPARQARIAVGRVADQREVVGDRRRRDAELLDDAGLVARDARPAIQLDDARAAHALGEVLVRRADDHAFDTRIASRRHRPGGERIVRLELHHRPDDDAGRREGVFEQWELRQQVGFDAFAGLVARPQSIAERLDDVIGGDGDVRGAAA